MGIPCPECDDIWGMRYTSDRSGNVRHYTCSKCDTKWLATIKGLKSGTAMAEPKGLTMDDFHWAKIL